MKFNICILFVILGLVSCSGSTNPVEQSNNQLTQGNVQLNLQVGKTNKAQVLEVFGAPNVTTRDGKGREVWSYQRSAQVSQSNKKKGYWTIIFAGGEGQSSSSQSSSRMITLIIKFNENDVVVDFASRESNF